MSESITLVSQQNRLIAMCMYCQIVRPTLSAFSSYHSTVLLYFSLVSSVGARLTFNMFNPPVFVFQAVSTINLSSLPSQPGMMLCNSRAKASSFKFAVGFRAQGMKALTRPSILFAAGGEDRHSQ